MKRILCFGDSNTYGFIPANGKRFDINTRWTGILKQKLAPHFEIIEGGCNNRNGFIDSNGGEELTGYKILPKYLEENPDFVILAIGINDVQLFYKPELKDIENGLISMIKTIQDRNAQVILLSPPILNNDILKGYFACQFDKESVELSKNLPKLYKQTAETLNCHYIDINKYTTVSSLDGLHYSAASHSIIANILYNHIVKLKHSF